MADKLKGTYTSAPERRFVERARHTEKGVNIDDALAEAGVKYTAGNNIQISDTNVISATDTKYTAGTNITISEENVISSTSTAYTAGDGITISEQNVISNSIHLYRHFINFTLTSSSEPNTRCQISFEIINTSNSSINTYNKLSEVFKNNITVCTGVFYYESDSKYTYARNVSISSSSMTLYGNIIENNDYTDILQTFSINSYTVSMYDQIYQIC